MKKLVSLTAALIVAALLLPSMSSAVTEHEMPSCQNEIHDLEIAVETADAICGSYSANDCAYARQVVAQKTRAVNDCLKGR